MNVVLDTNILIDYLKGLPEAAAEIEKSRDAAISIVTWMEVMVGVPEELEVSTREFLGHFALFQVTDLIAERAVSLRRAHRLKLLDAIIWATADVNSLPLVTRNTKDFPATAQGIRIPYVLQT